MRETDLTSLDKTRLRAFLQAGLRQSQFENQGQVDGDHRLNPDFQSRVVDRAIKPAAVLIGIIERANGFHVVFTQRTEKLKSHSGQISFPGGKIDVVDANPQMAALRETHEEIGVSADKVEVIGQMHDYFTGSGYKISPVIGLLAADSQFVANPDEVAEIFEVPLAFLVDPQNHQRGSRVFQEKERFFYEIRWQDYYIWGVTAGIIKVFYDRIFK